MKDNSFSFLRIMSMNSSIGRKPCPGFWDYCKFLGAMFLPGIGPLWAFIKGVIRAWGKNIVYNVPTTKYYYKPDGRYKTGRRIVGSRTVNKKVSYLKSESPQEDVKRFHLHAYIYIIVSLFVAGLQVYLYTIS